jgi:hypothetical protein
MERLEDSWHELGRSLESQFRANHRFEEAGDKK